MPILQKYQPTANTCVSTCLGMISGLPVEIIIEEFHEAFHNFEIDEKSYMEKKGVILERTDNRTHLEFGKVYLLVVPSLNSVGQFHMVVCDTRNREQGMEIFDPARKTSQRYVAHDADPGETPILTWIINYEVVHSPAINVIKDAR